MAEVKLPQLGESVTEGTITAWLIEVGAEVQEDQPLYEISTDKIDTEVPSPASGVLKEIRAQVDDTVQVGEVVAIIEAAGESSGDGAGAEAAPAQEDGDAASGAAAPAPEESDADDGELAAPAAQREAVASGGDATDAEGDAPGSGAKARDGKSGAGAQTTEPERSPARAEAATSDGGNGSGALMSPLVRKLISEHDLDASTIEGTGKGGRITRDDVEAALAGGGGQATAAAPGEAAPATKAAPAATRPAATGDRVRTEKLTRVRAAIAKHMFQSLQTTAQLTAAREVDMTRIMLVREQVKDAFKEREGVSLSPLPFVARAVCMVLPHHPSVNSSIDVEGGTATFYDYVNLGMAVDAEAGLIVPNIKNAGDLTVSGLAKAIADLANRARSRKLQPDDVSGGTFTITNTGSRGVLFDTPVLNPPEVAILATPAIEKRPVAISDEGSDAIAIRWMTYLCLTYDHRMLDGADAARFLGDLKEVLETHDWAAEVGA